MNAQQYLEHWKQGEERGECPPSESPRTDSQITGLVRLYPQSLCQTEVVSAVFARDLEHELNACHAAITEAIENILSRGGDEQWPIIKRLRAAAASK